VQITISVTAVNFLGAKSAPVHHQITRKSLPPPLVSVTLDPPPYHKHRALAGFASASFSECAAPEAISALSFSWVISKVGLVSPSLRLSCFPLVVSPPLPPSLSLYFLSFLQSLHASIPSSLPASPLDSFISSAHIPSETKFLENAGNHSPS